MDIRNFDLYFLPWRDVAQPHFHDVFPFRGIITYVTSFSPLVLMVFKLSLSLGLRLYHSSSCSASKADLKIVDGCRWVYREDIQYI